MAAGDHDFAQDAMSLGGSVNPNPLLRHRSYRRPGTKEWYQPCRNLSGLLQMTKMSGIWQKVEWHAWQPRLQLPADRRGGDAVLFAPQAYHRHTQ
jgi:hypothetical protein